MRILQVHNRHRDKGGEDIVVERERALLQARGHVVESYEVENPTARLRSAGDFIRSPWNRAAARSVREAARAFAPDVVHVHNTWFSLSPSVFATLFEDRRPVVATLHNFRTSCMNGLLLRNGAYCDRCVGARPLPGVVHRCYRDSFVLSAVAAAAVAVPQYRGTWRNHVDRFLVLDEGVIPTLVDGGIPADRITVRRNFADDPGARSTPPSLGTEVLYVGRLDAEKGIDLLVDAWCRSRHSNLRLRVFGDGPRYPDLSARSSTDITYAGFADRTTITQAMLSARVLAFPSVCREAGPLAPIEAAAAGLPVIMSDSVGVAAGVVGSGAGWSFPSGDVGALSRVLEAIADGADVDRAGLAAKDLYQAHHTPDAAGATLESAYELAICHLDNRRVNDEGSEPGRV